MRWHAAAASAAAPRDRYIHDSLFVNAGVLVSLLLMTPAAFAFVGISVKMLWHAAAALAAAPGDLHVSEFLFAVVGLCHVLAFCWNNLHWQSCALGAVVFWICDIGAALAWSLPGSCKKHSGAFSKEKGYDSLLQASTQALTPVDPGDFVTIKGWDGHSIDGSLSLGERQATGRVDVPVGAMEFATSFDYVDAALLYRSPQCVVLVNPASHVEKKEKTVFVKGVEGKTRVRRVVDSTQIWELLDDGIDMWAAVNGKRVDVHDTMAKIGIHDQDTIRCYGRLKGGAQRFRQPPQDIPCQWSWSLCGQEWVWPTKVRCFRCGNPGKSWSACSSCSCHRSHWKASTENARHEPDFPAQWSPEQDFGPTHASCSVNAAVPDSAQTVTN